jgi:hypothetical protein
MAYTAKQVASINAAREANVNAGRSAYSGAGATAVSVAAGLGGATSVPSQNINNPAISATSLTTPQTAVPLPAQPITTATPEMTAGIVSGLPQMGVVDNTEKIASRIKDLLPTPPSQADVYSKVYGISPEQARVNQEAAQRDVNTYSNQIQTINQNAQADILSARNQSSSEGGTAGILSAREDAVNRSAAIQTLRIAPLLSMAQGNLDIANKRLDDYFKVLSDDATNQYNYRTTLAKTIMDYADKDQERQITAINKVQDRNFTQQQSLLEYARSVGTTAAKIGDRATVSAITNLPTLDFASPTFAQDVVRYNQQLSAIQSKAKTDPLYTLQIENQRLDNQKLQKEISLLGEPTAKERKEIEVALQNAKTAVPAMQDKINLVDSISTSAGLGSRVGTNFLSRTPQGEGLFGGLKVAGQTLLKIPLTLGVGTAGDVGASVTGSGQNFSAQVHQLVSGLSLQSLITAKQQGATFGALSDREMNILANSATRLNDWEIKDSKGIGTGVWNIDEKSFKTELENIKSLTQRAILLQQGSLVLPDEMSVIDSVYSAQTQSLTPNNYYSNSTPNGI